MPDYNSGRPVEISRVKDQLRHLVLRAIAQVQAEGLLPPDVRSRLRDRAHAQSRSRRFCVQRRHAHGQARAPQPARSGTGHRRCVTAIGRNQQSRNRRPGLHQFLPESDGLSRRGAPRARRRAGIRPQRLRRAAQDADRVRVGQSDRTLARRSWPRRSRRRLPRAAVHGDRLARGPRVLLQRRRRADHQPRVVGAGALPQHRTGRSALAGRRLSRRLHQGCRAGVLRRRKRARRRSRRARERQRR